MAVHGVGRLRPSGRSSYRLQVGHLVAPNRMSRHWIVVLNPGQDMKVATPSKTGETDEAVVRRSVANTASTSTRGLPRSFCDIDAWVLSGMQVRVQAHVCILTVGCKWGMQLRWWFGILFGVRVDFRRIDGWVSWEVLFGVLFRVMVRAHFCSIDGRVLLGAFFGGCFWRC